MPRYSIRRYFEYCDEYHVDAETLEEADKKVDDALNLQGVIVEGNPQGVIQVADNAHADYTSTFGTEIDAKGKWITDPEEL